VPSIIKGGTCLRGGFNSSCSSDAKQRGRRSKKAVVPTISKLQVSELRGNPGRGKALQRPRRLKEEKNYAILSREQVAKPFWGRIS